MQHLALDTASRPDPKQARSSASSIRCPFYDAFAGDPSIPAALIHLSRHLRQITRQLHDNAKGVALDRILAQY
jgi:hypothetical protein